MNHVHTDTVKTLYTSPGACERGPGAVCRRALRRRGAERRVSRQIVRDRHETRVVV